MLQTVIQSTPGTNRRLQLERKKLSLWQSEEVSSRELCQNDRCSLRLAAYRPRSRNEQRKWEVGEKEEVWEEGDGRDAR